MAVYRSDQAQLTIGVEAAQGGDPEMNSGTRHTGGFSGQINNEFNGVFPLTHSFQFVS